MMTIDRRQEASSGVAEHRTSIRCPPRWISRLAALVAVGLVPSPELFAKDIAGILVNDAGFPVSKAYVNLIGENIWKGVRTDDSGRFSIKGVPDDATFLVALSQRSHRMGVIPITAEMPADRCYPLEYFESTIEGRVIDSKGKAAAGVPVTFHLTGPGGLKFTRRMWEQTSAAGAIRDWDIPSGPGWAIRAALESGESTPPVAMPLGGLIDLPDLIQRADADPAAPPAAEMVTYSGKVVDEAGKPISGVKVTVDRSQSIGYTFTDSEGRWSRRLPLDMPRSDIRLEHPDFVGWHFDDNRAPPAREAMLDGSAIQVMTCGFRIRGTVQDPAGKPVGNALVLAGQLYSRTPSPESEPLEDSTSARTDRDGAFSIGGIPPGLRHVVTLVDGYAPARLSVTINEKIQPLEFVLELGRTVTGRIVDDAGNPIPDRRIGSGEWIMPNSYGIPIARIATSGSDGRFTFGALPRQGSFWGYASAGPARTTLGMNFEIVPGVDDLGDLTLYSIPVIEGTVVDDETGAPVSRFLVTDGRLDEDGRFVAARLPEPVESQAGAFRRVEDWMVLSTIHEVRFVAKIGASGYAAALTPPLIPGKPYGPVRVRLRKAPSLQGRVRTPDGEAATGANVYFVRPHNYAFVKGTTLYDGFTYTPDVRTTVNEDGTFELGAQEEKGRLLFLHASGYAIVPSADFESGRNVSLVRWARIEGTYRPGGKPKRSIRVNAMPLRPALARTTRDQIEFDLQATTDEQGLFVMDHVPALQLRVGAHSGFGFGAAEMIQVQPGRTNAVSLASDGFPVKGRVDLSDVIAAHPPEGNLPFDTQNSWVRAVRVEPAPEVPQGADPDDWKSQLRAVLDGNVPYDLTIPALFSELQPDGSYAFEGLTPGRYVLLLEIHGERQANSCGWGLVLSRARTGFTVTDAPLTVAAFKLQPASHPERGDIAPEIEGTTATGESFALSHQRGKFVVLDFWAGWCTPCRASQPTLQAIERKYKEHVVFVGLNFDHNFAAARKASQAIKSPWPQALTGPWDADNKILLAYGVEVIPSLWLLDPDGKVVAKHLSLEELETTLAAALKK